MPTPIYARPVCRSAWSSPGPRSSSSPTPPPWCHQAGRPAWKSPATSACGESRGSREGSDGDAGRRPDPAGSRPEPAGDDRRRDGADASEERGLPDRQGGAGRVRRALQRARGDDRPGGGDPHPPRVPRAGGPADRRGLPAGDDVGRGRVPPQRSLRWRHAPAGHHPGGPGRVGWTGRGARMHDVPSPGRRGPHSGQRADGRHRALPGGAHHPADPPVPRRRARRESVRPAVPQRAHSRGVHGRPHGPGGGRPPRRDPAQRAVRRYGTETVLGYVEELLERAEILTRRGIEAIPDGTYASPTGWTTTGSRTDRSGSRWPSRCGGPR